MTIALEFEAQGIGKLLLPCRRPAGAEAAAKKRAEHEGSARTVSELLKPPRTRLAGAVEQLLRDSSPQFLVDHCHRSFELAMLIAAAGRIELDVEVLFAGILLHDLGLTPRFHSRDVRFEVSSANAARDLVRAHGMSLARAEKVWDVVALHGTGGIADIKCPETSVASTRSEPT